MITKEIQQALVEVNVILDNMEGELVRKIPKELQTRIKEHADVDYTFNYDATVPLSSQKIKPETKGIMAFLYKEYICDEKEKQEFIARYSEVINNLEQEKVEFNAKELFVSSGKENVSSQTNMPVIKQKWYEKIINIFKKLFTTKK